ncbi:MAG: OmpA family protein [Deltaproteobacteria bacterium]|nr:OmpA family protein [Deltaproteobacteria bacterium]
MAKKKSSDNEVPAWMITFSDLMTLLLTFFVLLLSMSAILDERKRRVVLGSVIGAFGIGDKGVDALTTKPKSQMVEPGPIEDVKDLEFVRPMVWDDKTLDLDFQSNRFIQVVTVGSDILFAPGSWELSIQGMASLDKLLPGLQQVEYPLLLAGHSGILRDELGEVYRAADQEDGLRMEAWQISLYRTLTVYRYLLDGGVDPEKLRMEAFGSTKPRVSNDTPEGREANRRVEFILDKRNSSWAARLEAPSEAKVEKGRFMFKDFIFDLK